MKDVEGSLPMRMRRLSGLEEHFMRRRSSVMRSTEGTSSKLAVELLAILAQLGLFFIATRTREGGRENVNEKEWRERKKADSLSSDLPTLHTQAVWSYQVLSIDCCALQVSQSFSLIMTKFNHKFSLKSETWTLDR